MTEKNLDALCSCSSLEALHKYCQFMVADNIPNYEELTPNDLCNAYIKYEDCHNDFLMNAYLCAIMLHYWKKVEYGFRRQNNTFVTKEEYFEVFAEAILNALNRRDWIDENKVISKDEAACDKIINRCIKTAMTNHYIFNNRLKRKVMFKMISLEYLQETSPDGFLLEYKDMDNSLNPTITNHIKEYFFGKKYLSAIILDSLFHSNHFVHERDAKGNVFSSFSKKSLIKELVHTSDEKCQVIADRYTVEYTCVRDTLTKLSELPTQKIVEKIDTCFDGFRKDREFINYLRS